MANSGRLLKEAEIQAIKEALNADDTDYSGLLDSFISSLRSSFSENSDTALANVPAVAGAALALVAGAGLATISIPLLLEILDLCVDVDGTYEEYKHRWQSDPDNQDWYGNTQKRKNNILLGDALTFGSSSGEFIERNPDGSYDFYSLFKPEFVNKHLGRALNIFRSSSDNVIRTENNDEFDFSRPFFLEDYNFNYLLGKALNYGTGEKDYFVKQRDTSSFDFSRILAFCYAEGTSQEVITHLSKELQVAALYGSAFYK